jgi:hypothetical protein
VASRYQLWMDGAPVDASAYDLVGLIEVEEHADAPATLVLRLPVSRTEDGDLSQVGNPALQPLTPLAVTVTPAEAAPSGCIFDGVVLGHRIHLEPGLQSASLEVYAQDRGWLLGLRERTKEWVNLTDNLVASSIFADYGIIPAPQNADDDSGLYTEDAHSLMQRGSDLDLLRLLARRGGRHLRVAGGTIPGAPVGVFARPSLEGEAALVLRPNDARAANSGAVDIEWDVMRPTAVQTREALFTDPSEDGANGDADDSGLTALAGSNLAAFVGEPMSVILTAVVDDADQLKRRARALLGEAQWFVRCTTEVDLAVVGVLVRAGDIVRLDTVGSLHSGKYLVWSVRHSIGTTGHKMNLTLVRNAVGAAQGGGLPGGFL